MNSYEDSMYNEEKDTLSECAALSQEKFTMLSTLDYCCRKIFQIGTKEIKVGIMQ